MFHKLEDKVAGERDESVDRIVDDFQFVFGLQTLTINYDNKVVPQILQN
tara:strand:- start:423 stop:569 length:147 start_codon:yes stop_codon:yes gene_type:complete